MDIACNSGTHPVQSKDIAQRHNIPERYLEQVLQSLVRAKILKGVRGPRGGYRLARERRKITVGEITRVIYTSDQDDKLAQEMFSSPLSKGVIFPFWVDMRESIIKHLDQTTVDDLYNVACTKGIKNSLSPIVTYCI